METSKKWNELSIKDQTSNYIDHVYKEYYGSYLLDSERFERINNRYHLLIVLTGFLTTILLALKDKIEFIYPNLNLGIVVCTLCLPSIGSVLLIYVTQRGFKKKEELRENARIRCKYVVNKAKIDFTSCKTDEEYKTVYNMLNEECQKLQMDQANGYFVSQDSMNK